MDIRLDKDFDFRLDDRNDLPIVTGRDLFEQRLRISVVSAFIELIGDTNRSSVLQMVELEAQRIARQYEDIEEAVQIRAAFDEEQPNTINVFVVYDTGGEFTFSIAE
mgnify:CR=1 FL=1